MKKMSLKRMLEAAEAGVLPEEPSSKIVSKPVDLYNLPDQLESTDIEKIVEKASNIGEEITTSEDVERVLDQLRSLLTQNRSERDQYASEPEKFLQSEVLLDEQIKKLHSLALMPDLFEAFITQGGHNLLKDLLEHENEDISVEVLRVLADLTDETVIENVPDAESFVLNFVDFAPVLSSMIFRLIKESHESMTSCLQVIYNFIEIVLEMCEYFATNEFINNLSQIISTKSENPEWMYNRSFSVELMLIISQSTSVSNFESIFSESTLNALLTSLSEFRRNSPQDSLEEEFLEYLGDTICLLTESAVLRTVVGELEGVELFIRFLRSENRDRVRLGLKLVNNVIRDNVINCDVFVEQLGLKVLGGVLTGQSKLSKNINEQNEALEHTVSILYSLLKNCRRNNPRVVGKLTENDLEKTRAFANFF